MPFDLVPVLFGKVYHAGKPGSISKRASFHISANGKPAGQYDHYGKADDHTDQVIIVVNIESGLISRCGINSDKFSRIVKEIHKDRCTGNKHDDDNDRDLANFPV